MEKNADLVKANRLLSIAEDQASKIEAIASLAYPVAPEELYPALRNIVDILNNINDAKSHIGLVMWKQGRNADLVEADRLLSIAEDQAGKIEAIASPFLAIATSSFSSSVVHPANLRVMTVAQLQDLARQRGIIGYSNKRKDELIAMLQ